MENHDDQSRPRFSISQTSPSPVSRLLRTLGKTLPGLDLTNEESLSAEDKRRVMGMPRHDDKMHQPTNAMLETPTMR